MELKSLYRLLIITQIVFSIQNLFSQSDINWRIGTNWTFDKTIRAVPIVDYTRFTIIDTTTLNGKKVFQIQQDSSDNYEYCYIEDNRVYFYIKYYDEFQLTYAFDELYSYDSEWNGLCHDQENEIAEILIDSIYSQDGLEYQNLVVKNSGSTSADLPIKVIKNIGSINGGLKLPLGYALCDFGEFIGELRCFENGDQLVNLVDHPCDSTWVISKTKDFNIEKIKISPNPSIGSIFIDNKFLNSRYQIIDCYGNIIADEIISTNNIYTDFKGAAILKIIQEEKIYLSKIIFIK